jgi:hypothetical protein
VTEIPDGPADPVQAASGAVEAWARTAPPRPPGPFDNLAWIIDMGLEVRITGHGAGMRVTLFDYGKQVGEPVTTWPSEAFGAALAMARMVAEAAGCPPEGAAP